MIIQVSLGCVCSLTDIGFSDPPKMIQPPTGATHDLTKARSEQTKKDEEYAHVIPIRAF